MNVVHPFATEMNMISDIIPVEKCSQFVQFFQESSKMMQQVLELILAGAHMQTVVGDIFQVATAVFADGRRSDSPVADDVKERVLEAYRSERVAEGLYSSTFVDLEAFDGTEMEREMFLEENRYCSSLFIIGCVVQLAVFQDT